mmetsp:Transcript_65651/g.136747  ORF Transcript_65651/g.136747 Transcript_65651/m.136747 type:complete len:237 (+) Transcript_65651:361-1071(+)
MHLIHLLEHTARQMLHVLLKNIQILRELLHARRADDRRAAVEPAVTEPQRQVLKRHAGTLRNGCITLDCFHAARSCEPSHPLWVLLETALGGEGIGREKRSLLRNVFVGEHAATERCPWEEGDVVVRWRARFGQLALERSAEEGEVVLDRDGARALDGVRGPYPLAHAKGSFVGQPVVSNLLRIDEFLDGCDGFCNRNAVRALLVWVVGVCAEDWSIAVRPVDLVQVDAVCLQPFE